MAETKQTTSASTTEDAAYVSVPGVHLRGAFAADTLYRQIVETVRIWVIGSYLDAPAHLVGESRLPDDAVYWVYPSGTTHNLGWGNPPGPEGADKVLRGKRIRVTFSIEDHNPSFT